jgi:hypothetical protein
MTTQNWSEDNLELRIDLHTVNSEATFSFLPFTPPTPLPPLPPSPLAVFQIRIGLEMFLPVDDFGRHVPSSGRLSHPSL